MSDGEERIEIPEGEYKDVLYEDAQTVEIVRGDEGYHVVKKGIRPFFARLFADGAHLDLSAVRTRVEVAKGGLSQKIFTDPDSENVRHRAAHLRRRMPVWHRLPEPEDEEAGHDFMTKALYGVLTLVVLALPFIGGEVAGSYLNAPLVGMGVGTVLLAVESYGAVDGQIEFEPAPRHFVSADASLTILQNDYSDAKTFEDLQDTVWDERTRTSLDALRLEKKRDKTVTQKLNESSLGMDQNVLGGPLDDSVGADDDSDVDARRENGSSAKPVKTDGGDDDE